MMSMHSIMQEEGNRLARAGNAYYVMNRGNVCIYIFTLLDFLHIYPVFLTL